MTKDANKFRLTHRHSDWVEGAVISESTNEFGVQRYTAKVRGTGRWYIWEGEAPFPLEQIRTKVTQIRDHIDSNEEGVFCLNSKIPLLLTESSSVKLPQTLLQIANWIYDLLEEKFLASKGMRSNFTHWFQDVKGTEYRFGGTLGFGGKFWKTHGRWYVNQYSENKTATSQKLIEEVNQTLADMRQKIINKN